MSNSSATMISRRLASAESGINDHDQHDAITSAGEWLARSWRT